MHVGFNQGMFNTISAPQDTFFSPKNNVDDGDVPRKKLKLADIMNQTTQDKGSMTFEMLNSDTDLL